MIQYPMADDSEIRRENFRKLWGERWSPTEAARKLWGTPSLWSDLVAGRKSFGEKLARKIEDKLSLPRLSLDDPGGAMREPLSAEVIDALRLAPEMERVRLENMLRAHFGLPLVLPADSSGKRSQRVA